MNHATRTHAGSLGGCNLQWLHYALLAVSGFLVAVRNSLLPWHDKPATGFRFGMVATRVCREKCRPMRQIQYILYDEMTGYVIMTYRMYDLQYV